MQCILNAEIICVGTELLLGDVVNTNATFIARKLAELGINVYNQHVVGDNERRLTSLLNQVLKNCDLIILTGGLGPTCDDLTKEVVAKFFDLKLQIDSKILKSIVCFFEKKGYEMTQNNKKQALVPEGATVLENKNGTAPGLIIDKNQKTIILLPGPPKEMEWMFERQVMPYLRSKSNMAFISQNINIFGIGESKVEEKLYDLMQNLKNPTLAPYAKDGEVLLRVTCSEKSRDEAIKKIKPIINEIRYRLGDDYIYGINAKSLQNVVVNKLIERKLKVATAESCTGGLISKRITEIPGASNVFELGVCAYANSIKEKVLGVKRETLNKFGAVSKETALEMAKGVRKISNADIGVSSTGIAGPGGGTKEKPVGLVYVAIDTENYSDFRELKLGSGFSIEREDIRYVASSHALHLLLGCC